MNAPISLRAMRLHFMLDHTSISRLQLFGISCNSAPVAICESYYSDHLELEKWLSALKAFLKNAPETGGETGGFIISTCDRTEIYIYGNAAIDGKLFFKTHPSHRAEDQKFFYHKQGSDAIEHWLKIASGLDSRMIGESQITGQMKEQIARAQQIELWSKPLEHIHQFILHHSAKIRTQTGIGEGVVSLTNAALALTRDMFGDIRGLSGLIIGLSETAESIATRCEQAGALKFHLTAKSRRAKRIAGLRDRHYIEFDPLAGMLSSYDIIVSAHGTGEILISKPQIEHALKKRAQRPILLLDGGEPHDFDPAIKQLSEAYYFNLEQLKTSTNHARSIREDAAKNAHLMVTAALQEIDDHAANADLVFYINGLKDKFEQARQEVLKINPSDDAAIATQLLVNKLLHLPIKALKQTATQTDRQALTQIITDLYQLDDIKNKD